MLHQISVVRFRENSFLSGFPFGRHLPTSLNGNPDANSTDEYNYFFINNLKDSEQKRLITDSRPFRETKSKCGADFWGASPWQVFGIRSASKGSGYS